MGPGKRGRKRKKVTTQYKKKRVRSEFAMPPGSRFKTLVLSSRDDSWSAEKWKQVVSSRIAQLQNIVFQLKSVQHDNMTLKKKRETLHDLQFVHSGGNKHDLLEKIQLHISSNQQDLVIMQKLKDLPFTEDECYSINQDAEPEKQFQILLDKRCAPGGVCAPDVVEQDEEVGEDELDEPVELQEGEDDDDESESSGEEDDVVGLNKNDLEARAAEDDVLKWCKNHGYLGKDNQDIIRVLSHVSVSVSTFKQYVAAAIEVFEEQRKV